MDAAAFQFRGYPESLVFIHASCGTVIDVLPGSDALGEVEEGNCDCESGGPWFRVYVDPDALNRWLHP